MERGTLDPKERSLTGEDLVEIELLPSHNVDHTLAKFMLLLADVSSSDLTGVPK